MEDRLAREIKDLLVRKGLTLAVAESATGGLVSSRLTDVPGCSLCFKGGVVAYSNDVKAKVLGVKKETIERYGAVSEQTCREMAEGVRKLIEADIGLSDTGIAGPGGARPEKPVGLFFVGLSTKEGTTVERRLFSGDRMENKRRATEAALIILRDYLAATR
ncbi:MAG: nicotinamide-nucleotide amidohydrolase family protein [Chloroflexi bacterium]|nr:nicotinamide-nucleotide amidohydrolase family protein [Chloroflexota bacterium]